MKTLKLKNGDLVFDEKGELELVHGDEEIAQGAELCLSIREGEFELDEYLGMDHSFLGKKRVADDEVAEAVLRALQIMTDQDVIDGADEITFNRSGRKGYISLRLIKGDDDIRLEEVEMIGS